MVPAAASGALAPSQGGGVLVASAEDQGFFGLSFGLGAFPFVSLSPGRGEFMTSDNVSLGQAFWFLPNGGSRPKWLYKPDLADNDPRTKLDENKVTYSYDGVTDISGGLLQQRIDVWARNGLTVVKKPYLEIAATLTTGEMVLLSIPQSSNPKFAKVFARVNGKGGRISETWIYAYKGEMVTKAIKDFIPWDFALQGDVVNGATL
jgi:hypothetical protein